jgi:hypothetical protein
MHAYLRIHVYIYMCERSLISNDLQIEQWKRIQIPET